MTRTLLAFAATLLPPLALHAASPDTSDVGGFTIETRTRRIGAGGFPNTSANPFAKTTISEYRVLVGGKPLSTAHARREDANTEVEFEETVDTFWDVRVIAGAPRPALIAATTGIWLVTLEDDGPRVRLLAAPRQDLATWQWLDAENGAPGAEKSASVRDSRAEPRTLGGGTLLMLSHAGVLDVTTLAYHPLRLDSYEQTQSVNGFGAGQQPVRAVSPGRTQVVLVGSRYVDGFYEYAIVTAELASGKLRHVPFDSNATRFLGAEDATPAWLAHWFEWSRAPDGAERLAPRAHAVAPSWRGRVSEYGPEHMDYKLYPVDARMFDVVEHFLVAELGAQPAPAASDWSDAKTFRVDGKDVTLFRDKDHFGVALFPGHDARGLTAPGTAEVVRRIGARFDAVLASGEHEELFVRYPDHR